MALAHLVTMLLAVPVAPECPVDNQLVLGAGTQKALTVKKMTSFTFSNSDIAEVKALPNEMLLVVGKTADGRGELKVERAGAPPITYRVRVRLIKELECGLPPLELKGQFPCDSTLEMHLNSTFLYLDGFASSLEEWAAAKRVSEQFPSLVNLGRLDASVVTKTLTGANEALRRAGFPRANFVLAGREVLLEGEVNEGAETKLRAVEKEWRSKLELTQWKPKPRERLDGG